MPLTRRQRIELSAAIRARREALVKELETETADRNDPVEAADTERDIAELKELDAAALRLDKGTYGTCMDCGSEIEVERLFARPGALRCATCQKRREKTHAGPKPSTL